ncbi:MAG: hypothetical protein AAF755_00950 [Pseudomonadota bacterium]
MFRQLLKKLFTPSKTVLTKAAQEAAAREAAAEEAVTQDAAVEEASTQSVREQAPVSAPSEDPDPAPNDPPEPVSKLFITNWEMNLSNPDLFAADLALHAVSDTEPPTVGYGVALGYDGDDRLVKAQIWEDGRLSDYTGSRKLRRWKPFFGHPFPKAAKVNPLVAFFPEDASRMPHQIGGKMPEGFEIPKMRNPAGLQYVATLKPTENVLKGWDHPLHVVFPLFLAHFSRLDLDYGNPMAPVVIDEDAFEKAMGLHDFNYEDIRNPSEIRYARQRFFDADVGVGVRYIRDDQIGGAGAPIWFQSPELPRCPKSGNHMEFVAQLGSPHWLKVIGKPFKKLPSHHADAFSTFGFYGSGTAYIFYMPETKIVTVMAKSF